MNNFQFSFGANDIIEKYFSGRIKTIANLNEGDPYPHFEFEEVSGGSLLGFGEFGCVKEVEGFNLKRKNPSKKRVLMKENCILNGFHRYAIKTLRKDLRSSELSYAMIDLFIEANFLCRLNHPNIIKIRGTAGVSGQPTYSIIVDRLQETLTEKTKGWIKIKESFKCSKLLPMKRKHHMESLRLLQERLLCIFDIARAMRYIHEHGIVFRDLKPDNIGFDFRGNAKIFDFGLAKELPNSDQIGQDQFDASGMIGSRRYMAPEVALCKPYGFSVDTFSYAIVMWEILSLKVAFGNYDYETHADLVVHQQQRPKLKSKWSIEIKKLLVNCWCHNPNDRSTFPEICQCLTQIVDQNHSGKLSRNHHFLNLSSTDSCSRVLPG